MSDQAGISFSTLRVQPGDLIIIKIRDRITFEIAARIRAEVERMFGKDQKALVLLDGIDLIHVPRICPSCGTAISHDLEVKPKGEPDGYKGGLFKP